MIVPILVVDSVVKLPPEANGAVIEAGVGGLIWAERHGMAMAAVATDSARVGDTADMLRRGIVSGVNELADMVA